VSFILSSIIFQCCPGAEALTITKQHTLSALFGQDAIAIYGVIELIDY
jgi:hypothetical protein